MPISKKDLRERVDEIKKFADWMDSETRKPDGTWSDAHGREHAKDQLIYLRNRIQQFIDEV